MQVTTNAEEIKTEIPSMVSWDKRRDDEQDDDLTKTATPPPREDLSLRYTEKPGGVNSLSNVSEVNQVSATRKMSNL